MAPRARPASQEADPRSVSVAASWNLSRLGPVSADPVRDLQRTSARVISKTRGLSLIDQQAVAAGMAAFAEPYLTGEDAAARGVFWAAASEAEKHFPTNYQRQERRGVVFEEAGHTIAMLVQGVAIDTVMVRPPAGASFRGAVFPVEGIPRHRVTGDLGRRHVETWAVIELAGPIAWKLAGLWPDQRMIETHDRSAERHLLRFAPALPTANWLAHCRDQADALLRAHWSDVETLAAALLTANSLTAPDVAALLTSTPST